MRTTGILGDILPETVKWGIDAIPGLIRNESEQEWSPDYLLRLMAMVRPAEEVVEVLAKRMTLSNKELKRLTQWAAVHPLSDLPGEFGVQKLLYRMGQQAMLDAMRLEIVHLQDREQNEAANDMVKNIDLAENWVRPVFPITGKDLANLGMKPGEAMGKKLDALEDAWIESAFTLTRDELLAE